MSNANQSTYTYRTGSRRLCPRLPHPQKRTSTSLAECRACGAINCIVSRSCVEGSRVGAQRLGHHLIPSGRQPWPSHGRAPGARPALHPITRLARTPFRCSTLLIACGLPVCSHSTVPMPSVPEHVLRKTPIRLSPQANISKPQACQACQQRKRKVGPVTSEEADFERQRLRRSPPLLLSDADAHQDSATGRNRAAQHVRDEGSPAYSRSKSQTGVILSELMPLRKLT